MTLNKVALGSSGLNNMITIGYRSSINYVINCLRIFGSCFWWYVVILKMNPRFSPNIMCIFNYENLFRIFILCWKCLDLKKVLGKNRYMWYFTIPLPDILWFFFIPPSPKKLHVINGRPLTLLNYANLNTIFNRFF